MISTSLDTGADRLVFVAWHWYFVPRSSLRSARCTIRLTTRPPPLDRTTSSEESNREEPFHHVTLGRGKPA